MIIQIIQLIVCIFAFKFMADNKITNGSIEQYLMPMKSKIVELFNGNNAQFTREIGFAIQIVNSNSMLLQCSQESICKAIYNVALAGLTLNPIEKLAYLTPRWNSAKQCNEAILMPSYIGLSKLATDGTRVIKIDARIVYEGDEFEVQYEPNAQIKHNPKFKSKNIEYAYAIATINTDDQTIARPPQYQKQFEVMHITELHEIRALSDSWKAFEAKKAKSSIWNDHEGEMCKKTVIKRLQKYLPKDKSNTKLNYAIALDNIDYMASDSQLATIERLIQTSSFDEETKSEIERGLIALNRDAANDLITNLKNNQLDSIRDLARPSATDITEKLAKITE